MNKRSLYRNNLPQLGDKLFVTDGGLETVFVFQKEIDLPMFASFHLLTSAAGAKELEDYYLPYIDIATQGNAGVILDTATWRASKGWGAQLGYSEDDMRQLNQKSVRILETLRERHASAASPVVINGVIGPQDDGYSPSALMSADEALHYHRHQVAALADSAADMLSAITMTYVDEAVGIVRAAQEVAMPVVVSFTVETDGRLPDGTSLAQAVAEVDEATGNYPSYYMVNCAHPDHFSSVLTGDAGWKERIRGIRANASRMSHAELDESETLDDGNPSEFGELYGELRQLLPKLSVIGGCCGTDHRHVGAAAAVLG